jgi:hypothetical protein
MMKRDQQLVSDFVSAFNQQRGTSFKIVRWPDAEDRTNPAVEAVAEDPSGDTIAFEHTLIEPFEGKCADDARFMKVFGPLEGCRALIKPGYNVNIGVRVGAVPTGVKWEAVGERVREHLARIIPALGEADKVETIAGLPFALQVRLWVDPHEAGEADRVLLSRLLPTSSLKEVVRRALNRKLRKLVAERANRRLLLLEQADVAHGHADIRIAIDDLGSEFPELAEVDEIWLIITTCWESEGVLFFYELAPSLGGRRLKFESNASTAILAP